MSRSRRPNARILVSALPVAIADLLISDVGGLGAQDVSTDSSVIDYLRPDVPNYELVSDVFSPNLEGSRESLLYEGPDRLRMHLEWHPFTTPDYASKFLESHFVSVDRHDTIAGRWPGREDLPDTSDEDDAPHVAYRAGRHVIHVRPRFVMTDREATETFALQQARMVAQAGLAALTDGPAPVPTARRYAWSTTNVRAGPGTDHEVVEQLEPNVPQWVRSSPDRDWLLLVRGSGGRDTIGWVLGDLMHEEQYSPEQRQARAEREELQQVAATLRRSFADKMEHEYLMEGRDVTVTTRGEEARTLIIEYVLLGRPDAYQMQQNAELMDNLSDAGFRHVILTDGREEWDFDVP